MTKLELLKDLASRHPARVAITETMSEASVDNHLKLFGHDPATLRPGTPQQIAEWRANIGTSCGPYDAIQIRADKAAMADKPHKWMVQKPPHTSVFSMPGFVSSSVTRSDRVKYHENSGP